MKGVTSIFRNNLQQEKKPQRKIWKSLEAYFVSAFYDSNEDGQNPISAYSGSFFVEIEGWIQ